MNRMKSERRAMKGLVRYWATLALAMLLVGCGSGSDSEDAANERPSAEAGADQSVVAGATVTLRGTGSDTDGTIERYSWTRTSGPAVTLATADQAAVSFTAPAVDASTALVFRLVVSDDDGATSSDEVTVTVLPIANEPPSADAGMDQMVSQGTTVMLQGSASDADGTIASYSWTQIGSPAVALSAANQATASFVAPAVDANTALVFRLAVTDDNGATASDEVTVTVLSAVFRDCAECPEMVVIPAGSFLMGSPSSEEGREDREGPQHRVEIAQSFAVGKYEVTFAEWDACRSAGGCSRNPDDEGWGRGNRPVINVSWDAAQEYVRWLVSETGKGYRLLTEAEWEYVARAGTTTPFHTGVTISTDQANYDGDHIYGSGRVGVDRRQTIAVGSFPANAFGLHDMHGNVLEWGEDCWHDNYVGAPADGSAWTEDGNCVARVLRGGSWSHGPGSLRSAHRSYGTFATNRFNNFGFRVARTLTPSNQPPGSDAGADQSVIEGATVTLRGTGSDTDGTIASYSWTQIGSPAVTLSATDQATTFFTAPSVDASTALVFRLTVSDDDGATASDEVTVTVIPAPNQPPNAEVSADQSVIEGATVTLGGTGSDTDGTIASYSWTQIGSPAVTLSATDQATTFFTAPSVDASTALVFRLTVTDDEGATGSDTVTVTVTPAPNQPPSAAAGADQRVIAGATVTLRGTGSDTDGTIASYSWTQTSGSAVSLTAADQAAVSFTAPAVAANTALVFRLTVSDDDGAISSDTVTVTVSPVPNQLPIAEAGVDQIVNEGATVTLRGTGSDTDGTIAGYSWTRTSGPAVALSGAAQTTASFTAPAVAGSTALVFRLTVSDDDGATASDEVTVTVIPAPNQPPNAEAGADQIVNEGTTVTLRGTGSDTDGTIASYSWTRTSGPAVILSAADQATASFTAPDVDANTALVFRLAVTDDNGATASDEVTITIVSIDDTTSYQGGGDAPMTGGTIVAGDLSVTVPDDALLAPIRIDVTEVALPMPLPADLQQVDDAVDIAISDADQNMLNAPLMITMVYDGEGLGEDQLVLPLHFEDGEYYPVSILSIDVDRKTVTFESRSFSVFVLAAFNSLSIPDSFDTGFKLLEDGWNIGNRAYYKDDGGNCYGMAGYAVWYFNSDRNDDLNGKFDRHIARLVAVRAHFSQSQTWAKAGWLAQRVSLSAIVGRHMKASLAYFGKPLIFLLGNIVSKHAGVVYGFDENGFKFYDVNYPNEEQTLPYDGFSFGTYRGYTRFGFVTPSMMGRNRDFEGLTREAEAGFTTSEDIVLTSPQENETITTRKAMLVGSLAGSLLDIHLRDIYLGGITGQLEEIPVNNGSFSHQIELDLEGENTLVLFAGINTSRHASWFENAATLVRTVNRRLEDPPQQPGEEFRDCGQCPEMVRIPAGSFLMGSPSDEKGRFDSEGPQHRVEIAQPFAVGKYEVTFAQWDACRSAGGCSRNPRDKGWGRGSRPVINVSWEDAQEYVGWLSRETGKDYRLLTEAEWEYAARAGTTTPFYTGVTISTDQANYNGNYTYGSGTVGVWRRQTVEVGMFAGNAFGLHDMHGNVWEWVEDCWHANYEGAPVDGSVWTEGGACSRRLLRGGAWDNTPGPLRAANRLGDAPSYRITINFGFRVVRTLTP